MNPGAPVDIKITAEDVNRVNGVRDAINAKINRNDTFYNVVSGTSQVVNGVNYKYIAFAYPTGQKVGVNIHTPPGVLLGDLTDATILVG